MKREVRLNVHSVRYRGEIREVYTLREPPRHVYLRDDWKYGSSLYADAGGFNGLADLAGLAARHPRRIFYFRRSGARLDSWQSEFRSDDLVLSHGQAQLRPAHWRDLRNHLGKARPCRLTYEALPPDFKYDLPYENHGGRGVVYATHSSTQFFSGETEALLALAQMWGHWLLGEAHEMYANAWSFARRRWGGGEQFDHHSISWTQWLEGPDYRESFTVSLDDGWYQDAEEAKRAMREWGFSFVRQRGRWLWFRPYDKS
ncbi:MAG: hypothetical protein ACO1SV_18235 [Fimbriimonas sp.]